jgi:mono/diheme cytochrome c family protein
MTWRRALPLTIVVALLAIGSACGSAPEQQGDPAAGEELFNTKLEEEPGRHACSECHSLGISETYAPSLQTVRNNATVRIEGVSAEDYLQESIVDPEAHKVGNFPVSMPTVYGEILTAEQITNLIAFILSE